MIMRIAVSIGALKNICDLLARGLFCCWLFVSGAACASDTAKGGELYAVHCASCHGASGDSVMLSAPNFNRADSLLKPDLVLLGFIKGGKNMMPAYQGILSDSDILDVIAYLRTLN